MSDHLHVIRRLSAALFVLAAGIVAVIVQLPGVDHGNQAAIDILLAAAAVSGLLVWWFPWERFHPNLFLVAGVVADLLLALLLFWTGGGSSIFFPIYVFVVVAAGAYYRTAPLVFITALSCLSASSYLLYSGPLTLTVVLPLLPLLPVLVAVAIICNVLYRRLERNVVDAAYRARFIEALHEIDRAILSEGDEQEVLRIATERTKDLLDCQEARIEPVLSDAPLEGALEGNFSEPLAARPRVLRIPLVARGETLGQLTLVWTRRRTIDPSIHLLARNFAAQIALAIQGARLHRQAERVRALTELNRLKDEFISTASHELRTPLTSIVGFSELLVKGRVASGNEESVYLAISRSAQHLASLVDDLLDVSRLEAGRLQLNLQLKDLRELAAQVGAEMAPVSASHEIVVRVDDTPADVFMDERRIHQVLVNLIANAIRYSPNGGKVTIEVRSEGSHVAVEVADEGIGIRREVLDRLFEKFYRAPNAPDSTYATGLGLALCRGFVQAHGGRIWASSEGEGRGSRFSFVLPRVDPAAARNDASRPLLSAG